MTNDVIASAPGKLVLSGEYAVLDGAPAICMAVSRRARAAVVDTRGDISTVMAPGYTSAVGRFQYTDDGIEWQEGGGSFALVDAVFQASELAWMGAKMIKLDTTEFFDLATQQKLGIGSSAALTVALCAAVRKSADVAALTMPAQSAHALLQEGAGSGVDIACSLQGGLMEYRMEDASATVLQWPEGLSYRLIWTGIAASTREKLSKLAADISSPSRPGLAAASEDMAMAWGSGDASQIIAGYRDYCEQLRQFSTDHELGIFDAGHDELCDAASAASLCYKPCGAGGGDVGILLGLDGVDLDAFMNTQPTRYSVLDCEMSPTGARIDA